MKTELRVDRTLVHGVYHVTLALQLGTTDQEHVRMKGAPVIDLGGEFTGDVTYTLPERVRRLTESPFAGSFDGNVDDDAKAKAATWATAIEARVVDALAQLRYEPEDYESTRVVTL